MRIREIDYDTDKIRQEIWITEKLERNTVIGNQQRMTKSGSVSDLTTPV